MTASTAWEISTPCTAASWLRPIPSARARRGRCWSEQSSGKTPLPNSRVTWRRSWVLDRIERSGNVRKVGVEEQGPYVRPVDALSAHGLIRGNRDFKVVAFSPSTKLPHPLLGTGFLRMGNGSAPRGLIKRLESALFFRRQSQCDGHDLHPMSSLAQLMRGCVFHNGDALELVSDHYTGLAIGSQGSYHKRARLASHGEVHRGPKTGVSIA